MCLKSKGLERALSLYPQTQEFGAIGNTTFYWIIWNPIWKIKQICEWGAIFTLNILMFLFFMDTFYKNSYGHFHKLKFPYNLCFHRENYRSFQCLSIKECWKKEKKLKVIVFLQKFIFHWTQTSTPKRNSVVMEDGETSKGMKEHLRWWKYSTSWL